MATAATTGTVTCSDGPHTYDKSCKADDDCAFARVNVCCGDIPVVGVRKSEKKRVESLCPCAGMRACRLGPLVAEDGKSSRDMNGASDVVTRCVAGACKTSIR